MNRNQFQLIYLNVPIAEVDFKINQTKSWLEDNVKPAVEWGTTVGVSCVGITMIVALMAAFVKSRN